MTWQWITFQILIGLPVCLLGVTWMIYQIYTCVKTIIKGEMD